MSTEDPAYRKGLSYLISTQLDDGPHERQGAGSHVVGSDLVREVEHGDMASGVADDRLDHADELVGRPEVGQERDGVVGATHAATVGARRPGDLCRDANRAGADPPTAPALPARPGVPGAAS